MATDPAARPPAAAIRLQKVLAGAGVGSRRACEQLIAAGRVHVDGRRVTEQGVRVDPDSAIITVDGNRVATRSGTVYLLFNKPRGVLSTMTDPQGRTCLGDFVADRSERLFHVGRLDADTEGLILLTNDGQLAHRLTHPSFGVTKTYLADIPGPVPRDLARRLRQGIPLPDGPARVDRFKLVGSTGGRGLIEVSLHEGRNHVVRRMLEEAGHPVGRLVRTGIAGLTVGNLTPGRLRHLTRHEVSALFGAAGL